MPDKTQQQRAWINIAAILIMMGLLIGLSLYAVRSKDFSVFGYWLPLAIAIALVAMKWAWPKIPGYQLAMLGLSVASIHFGMEHFGPFASLLSEYVLEAVCVFGFGAFWVRRGYLSKEANRW